MDAQTRIGSFQVLRSLEGGGLGEVFLARHENTAALVRLTVLPAVRLLPSAMERLTRLAEVLRELHSEVLPAILSYGQLANEDLYVVTSWADGVPLLAWAKEVAEREIWPLLQALAEALAAAHAVETFHLELRPSSVVVAQLKDRSDFEAIPCLYDIGLRSLLHPPVAAISESTRAADVYALGVLAESIQKEANTNPGAAGTPSVRAHLRALLQQILDSNPARRPTMAEVATALAPPEAEVTKPTRRTPSPRKKAAAASTPRTMFQAKSLIGRTVGQHRIVSLLGQGGMGAVYEAEHIKIGRIDAVKVLFPDLAGEENAERFLREAQAANRVQHSSIVQIYHFGTTEDGLLYLVMERLAGEPLAARLKESPSGLQREQAFRLAFEVASALAAVHAKGIVHRDLTPRNIMLVPMGEGQQIQAKLLDFGIAKVPPKIAASADDRGDLTSIGDIFGTMEYMPPEQFQDAGSVDDKGDVFSLAVILCEMLTGERPFTGFANALFAPEPPRPKLPPGLSPRMRQLLARMLAFDATQRPPMSEVRTILDRELHPNRRWLTPIAIFGSFGICVVLGFLLLRLLRPPIVAPPPISTEALRIQSRAILTQAISDLDPEIRQIAATEVVENHLQELCDLLVPMVRDQDSKLRLAAVGAVASLQCQQGFRVVQASLDKDMPIKLRIESEYALATLGDDRMRSELRELSRQLEGDERLLAAQRLCQLTDSSGCRTLADLLAANQAIIPFAVALNAHRVLARNNDQQSLIWFADQMDQPDVQGSEDVLAKQLAAAAELAHSRGATRALEARTLIEKLAVQGDTRANFYAAQLRLPVDLDTLQRWITDPQKKSESRRLAIRAVAASGSTNLRLRILQALLSPATERPLAIAAAAAVLRLLGEERDLNAWEIDMLGGSNSSASLLAWLDDKQPLTPGQASTLFSQLNHDERRAFASLAGFRSNAHTLGLLSAVLDDASSDVRIEGLRAIHALLNAQLRAKPGPLTEAQTQQLQALEDSSHPNQQIVALSVRAWAGDAAAEARLLRMLERVADVKSRELIVELARPAAQSALLLAALGDRVRSVQFIAARSLAKLGSNAGRSVLEDCLKQGGGYALAAYGWLKHLGVQPAALDWMSLLNSEQNLVVRYEAVGTLGELPPAEVLGLLRFTLSDPAAVVRERAGMVAAEIYRQHGDPAFLDILQALLRDNEAIVRVHAARILRELGMANGVAEDAKSRLDLRGSEVADLEKPSPGRDMQSVTDGAVLAAPDMIANRPAPPPPPPNRPPPAPAVAPGIQQAALSAERRGDFLEAKRKWEALLQLPESQRTSSQAQAASQAIARLNKELGAFRLYRLVDGKCVPESNLRWGKPGDNYLSADKLNVYLYKGKQKEVTTLCDGK